MANLKPLFLTGANAKIKMGGKTIAYATDVSCTVSTPTVPVETMGRYEIVSNEPIAYFVDGSLSIVRYTKIALQYAPAYAGTNPQGNKTDLWAPGHFIPGKLLASTTLDVEIYQKFSPTILSPGSTTAPTISTEEVIKVLNCRLSRRGMGLSKRGLYLESYTFDGIIAVDEGDDPFYSGDQDLS